jgi:hypothetical protein
MQAWQRREHAIAFAQHHRSDGKHIIAAWGANRQSAQERGRHLDGEESGMTQTNDLSQDVAVVLTGHAVKVSAGPIAESAVHRGPKVAGASGRKRHAYQTFHGHQFNALGQLMRKTQIIYRADDRYFEFVVNEETGEVVRHADERLSEHAGHGSAKFNAAQLLEPMVQALDGKA